MSLKIALVSALVTSVAAGPISKRQSAISSVQLPDYSQYYLSAFVPFANYKEGSPMDGTPTLSVKFEPGFLKTENKEFHPVSMDTGSTGYTFRWSDVSDSVKAKSASYQGGFKYLSSSKLLSTGYWVPVKLQFGGGETAVYTSTYVLAVKETIQDCVEQYYGKCTKKIGDTDKTKRSIDTDVLEKRGLQPIEKRAYWGYMGVGVGREDDGMQQATPEKNPLTNIYQIGSVKATDLNFRPGYIVRKDGIVFGLTKDNTAGFNVGQKLDHRDPPSAKNPQDTWNYPQTALSMNWDAPKMCITIQQADGSTPPPCVQGHWLVDTGLPSMYLTVPPSIGAKTHQITNPNNKKLKSNDLDDGQTLIVDLGLPEKIQIKRGSKSPEEPSTIITSVLEPSKKAPWANVGRHLLRTHDVMFDLAPEGQGGYYSIRSNSGSTSAPGSQAQVKSAVASTPVAHQNAQHGSQNRWDAYEYPYGSPLYNGY